MDDTQITTVMVMYTLIAITKMVYSVADMSSGNCQAMVPILKTLFGILASANKEDRQLNVNFMNNTQILQRQNHFMRQVRTFQVSSIKIGYKSR